MPYKIGDIVEVIGRKAYPQNHRFYAGERVTVKAVDYNPNSRTTLYKCDSEEDGRKRSFWVGKADLVKRRR